ncbi:MAG: [FeFe] hydrogenase H-cluster radical SAM maturase HydG [Candidatus Zixiibacteriota bacterium]
MGKTFIDPDKIEKLIEENKNPDKVQVREILDHAAEMKGIEPEQVAALMGVEDQEVWDEIFALARKIKDTLYGNRIVLFAPLYVSNYCANDCLYCGFRCSNTDATRISLSGEKLAREVLALENVGHKRLLMVYGEHPKWGIDYILDTIETAYQTRTEDGHGEIRRININAAPMDVDDYKKIKDVGIGTYQVFQETYHPGRYSEVHPKNTIKGDYDWRLYALHRAQEAGLDDVAIGALFGLYDWKFEILGLLYHALDMEKHFNVGPHTVSFPRLEPALNSPITTDSPYMVDNQDFRKLVAIIRLMVPYTGMILTAREKPEYRRDIINLGCSQIDAGTKIGIGSYSESTRYQELQKQQFTIYDTRSLDEVVRELVQMGFIPSFCTGCYRSSRTGETFMGITKKGDIHHMCHPNAILTLKEFLLDYASEKTKRAGMKLIEKELDKENGKMREFLKEKLEKIDKGKRDLYC